MTSKEALERLYDGYQYGMNGRSLYDIISQDLEILEILKTHIKIQKYYDSFETGDDRQWLEIDLDNSNIQFKKIKEWLTDE